MYVHTTSNYLQMFSHQTSPNNNVVFDNQGHATYSQNNFWVNPFHIYFQYPMKFHFLYVFFSLSCINM